MRTSQAVFQFVAAVVIGTTLPALPAAANSTSGAVEYTAEQCFGPNPDAVRVHGALTAMLSGNLYCPNRAITNTQQSFEEATHTPGAVTNLAIAAAGGADSAFDMASAAANEALAQATSLLGLPQAALIVSVSPGEATVDTGSYGQARVKVMNLERVVGDASASAATWSADPMRCVWVPSPCELPVREEWTTAWFGMSLWLPTPGDQVSKFTWVNDIEIPWDRNGNGHMRVDGLAWSNLYESEPQPNPAWRFYASSQANTVTPLSSKAKLKSVTGEITPGEEVQRVEMEPIDVHPYGSSGTINLGATLAGEAKTGMYGGGASFSIGRSWNVSEGHAGGAVDSQKNHVTVWVGNKGGTKWTKSSQGVETWKVPADDVFSWKYSVTWHTTK